MRDTERCEIPKGASSNPARVNIFQLTPAVSDYHEKFLFKLQQNSIAIFNFNIELKMWEESCFTQYTK